MYKLECWSICPASNGALSNYRPPEAQGIAVQAKKSTRPNFEDGILTTRIINIQGRVVTTRSGTTAELLLTSSGCGFLLHQLQNLDEGCESLQWYGIIIIKILSPEFVRKFRTFS